MNEQINIFIVICILMIFITTYLTSVMYIGIHLHKTSRIDFWHSFMISISAIMIALIVTILL